MAVIHLTGSRKAFPSILPAYPLNKKHWSSLILDGTVPDETVKRLILESCDLVKKGKRSEKPI
ncbi:MAG: MmcQ/YjbR family DNA-binding protein [Lachnospiraceae bacterium]